MTNSTRSFAIVTGASSGIGYELAKCCAEDGFDLLIAADQPEIEGAAQEFRTFGVSVDAVQADLAIFQGIQKLCNAINGRPVDALLANAGQGLGEAFFDQDFNDIQQVIDTNITGMLYLLHNIGRTMRTRNQGRILLTGSIAGHIPGAYQAVYHASKAFVDSFAVALRTELEETAITVTCLQPGPTETEFFARAGMEDTKVAQQEKADPADVARTGFDAMMRGDGNVVHGWKNQLQVAVANVLPADSVAEQNRKISEPGSAGE